jgi:hypothetical protein
MKLFKPRSLARSSRATSSFWLLALLLLVPLALVSSASAATAVPLATADSFAVLAGAGISNTGPTTIGGDVGTYPTTSITGAGSMTINGTNHAGDSVTQGAQTDLVTAYNNAAGQGPTSPIAADLAGLTLTPGVYNSASSIGLSGVLTLNGGGDPNAVFVFQAGSSLTTGSGSLVSLINGAQSCNVFWQVGSSATLGTGSTFRGTVIALTSITVTTGVTVDGRVLARNGAVTLDTDTISKPGCVTAPTPVTQPTTTTTPPVTTTTTAAPTGPTPAQRAAKAAAVRAKAAAARAAAAKRLAAAKKRAAVKAASSTAVGSARPAVRNVGLTG